MSTIMPTPASVPTPAYGLPTLPAPIVHTPWCDAKDHDEAAEFIKDLGCSSPIDTVSTAAGDASGYVQQRDGESVVLASFVGSDVILTADECDSLAGLLYRLADMARRGNR